MYSVSKQLLRRLWCVIAWEGRIANKAVCINSMKIIAEIRGKKLRRVLGNSDLQYHCYEQKLYFERRNAEEPEELNIWRLFFEKSTTRRKELQSLVNGEKPVLLACNENLIVSSTAGWFTSCAPPCHCNGCKWDQLLCPDVTETSWFRLRYEGFSCPWWEQQVKRGLRASSRTRGDLRCRGCWITRTEIVQSKSSMLRTCCSGWIKANEAFLE